MTNKKWWVFTGSDEPHDGIDRLPAPPEWRRFTGHATTPRNLATDQEMQRRLGVARNGKSNYRADPHVIDMVNTALYLRRPLLVTGKPGTGKSTLAHAVAWELKLGPVLGWPITSRATLQDALYRYDALGRLQAVNLAVQQQQLQTSQAQTKSKKQGAALLTDIGDFVRLGPVGTAFLPSQRPRVLLIDEIDKSDIDLPNDLLNLLEEGGYEIPELARLAKEQQTVDVFAQDGQDRVSIREGRVVCQAFPFVVITSNGERELPPPLLRRCLRLNIDPPTVEDLKDIVAAHFGPGQAEQHDSLIEAFYDRREKGAGHLATDQLLNAIYLAGNKTVGLEDVLDEVLRKL